MAKVCVKQGAPLRWENITAKLRKVARKVTQRKHSESLRKTWRSSAVRKLTAKLRKEVRKVTQRKHSETLCKTRRSSAVKEI